MLDLLAVLHPENVNDGVAVLAEKAGVLAVKEHKVSVCKNALNFTASVGIILGNPFDVVSKSIEAVCGERRMLLVSFPAIEPDRRIDISLKQGLLIKADHGLFVFFHSFIFGRHDFLLRCASS